MAVKTAQVTGTDIQPLTTAEKQQLRQALGIVDESKVLTVIVSSQSIINTVNAFNNSSVIFNIQDVSGIYIKAVTLFSLDPSGNVTPPTTRLYKLISKPQGSYELTPGGYGNNNKQIQADHLEISRLEQQSSSQDVQETVNTVINLGNIGTSTVHAHINASSTIRTIANFELSTTLIKSVIDGKQADYIYKGSGGTYGNGQINQLMPNDLQLINQETEGIPDNSIAEIKLTQAVKDKIRRPTVEITTTTYQFQSIDDLRNLKFTQPCTCVIPNGLSADLEFQGIGDIVVNAESGGTLNYSGAFINETFDANSFFGIRTMGSDISQLTGTLKLS